MSVYLADIDLQIYLIFYLIPLFAVVIGLLPGRPQINYNYVFRRYYTIIGAIR